MMLSDVVAVTGEVAATRSRKRKIELLCELISASDEPEILVGFLAGEPRQGKVGVGWASMYRQEVPPAPTASVTVAEADAWISELATISGPGSNALRSDAIGAMLARCTEGEQTYLVRLLTGEMRQGALEGVVVEAVGRAASVDAASVRRAVMVGGALPAAARAAMTGGEAALAEIRMEVLRPVRPMLASTAADAAEATTGPSVVDWKLDGVRIQAHRSGDEIRLFTRNLNDVTGRLPGIVEAVRSLPVASLIADGEAMTLGPDGRPRSFGETMSEFGADDSTPDVPMAPFFFDVLHLDGDDLIDVPLSDRLERLHAVVPDSMRVPITFTDDPGEVERILAEVVAAGHEGVMVKEADSLYQAGRRGSAWRKIKPVYTLDLVVLAAEWGHGRRTGWLSNLHLGARDGDEFVMLGKTFKGMTDAMLTWQTERLLELEERRTKQTVYVRPELVVEIALDGVIASPRYPGGLSLRFARVKQYREDKLPEEADTIDAVRALYER